MKFSKLVTAPLIIPTLPAADAAGSGSIGSTYPIGEGSTLDMVMKKLREKKHGGKLRRLQEGAIRCSMDSIKNIRPVDGITTVRAHAQCFIDPTVIYTEPVTTDDGRVAMPARTKINPLDMTSLTKTLVFFDGRDPEQCGAVGRLTAKGGQLKVKPVFAAGSWFGPTKAWKAQVFYDRKGTLSKRFGITAVPAVIRQQGKMLTLDEISVKELQ